MVYITDFRPFLHISSVKGSSDSVNVTLYEYRKILKVSTPESKHPLTELLQFWLHFDELGWHYVRPGKKNF